MLLSVVCRSGSVLRVAGRTGVLPACAARGGAMATGLPRAWMQLPLLRGVHVEHLPALGDSISEGTVQQWVAEDGAYVARDEVLALVETDKVVVEIRTSVAGRLIKKCVPEGDEVEVGMALFEIDDEDTAGVGQAENSAKAGTEAAPPAQEPEPAPAQAPAAQEPAVHEGQGHAHAHVPLIKFLGKRSLLPQGQEQPQQSKEIAHSPDAVDFETLPGAAQYGRPAMSDAEMEAVESGGATMIW